MSGLKFNKLSVQQFFPIVPRSVDWTTWNNEFIVYYGQENIPITEEVDWKHTADTIASSTTFSAYPVPSPQSYQTWQEWAEEVTAIINGKAY